MIRILTPCSAVLQLAWIVSNASRNVAVFLVHKRLPRGDYSTLISSCAVMVKIKLQGYMVY